MRLAAPTALYAAVLAALFGVVCTKRCYSAWARTALYAAGLDPERIPAPEVPAVLEVLEAAGRIVPRDEYVTSIQQAGAGPHSGPCAGRKLESRPFLRVAGEVLAHERLSQSGHRVLFALRGQHAEGVPLGGGQLQPHQDQAGRGFQVGSFLGHGFAPALWGLM